MREQGSDLEHRSLNDDVSICSGLEYKSTLHFHFKDIEYRQKIAMSCLKKQ